MIEYIVFESNVNAIPFIGRTFLRLTYHIYNSDDESDNNNSDNISYDESDGHSDDDIGK